MGAPEGLRSTITADELGGFRIIITPPANWLLRIFLLAWLCGWAAIEYGAAAALFLSRNGSVFLFMAFWLPFWTLGGIVASLTLVWNLAGREVILISEKILEIRTEIGPFARSKTFDVPRIRDLRYSPLRFDPRARPAGRAPRPGRLQGGSVAFDYESDFLSTIETNRFGDGLSEIETHRLIATIHQRFDIPEGPAAEPLPIVP